MGMHLMGVYLIGMYLTAVHLIGVVFIGVHLMGVHSSSRVIKGASVYREDVCAFKKVKFSFGDRLGAKKINPRRV
jgi:hypothetical protein